MPRKIEVVIPTRGRIGKLHKVLDSIPRSIGGFEGFNEITIIEKVVISDACPETVKEVISVRPDVDKLVYVKEHKGAVFCRNLVTPAVEDMLLYATDDITFNGGSIGFALKSLLELFPDGDGVIGFLQENAPNRNFNPAGVGLMGQKFIKRYPDRKIFYPGYFHFSCQEILWLAQKYDKFALDEGAKIYHFHPAFYPLLKDQTHEDARIHHQKDKDLKRKRKEKGKIWGNHSGGH